jgi:hypothetical protein
MAGRFGRKLNRFGYDEMLSHTPIKNSSIAHPPATQLLHHLPQDKVM